MRRLLFSALAGCAAIAALVGGAERGSAGSSGRYAVPHRALGALDSTLAQISDANSAHGLKAALAVASALDVDVSQQKVKVIVAAQDGVAAAETAVRSSGGTVTGTAPNTV